MAWTPRFWERSDTGLKVLRTAPFGGVKGTFPSSTLPPANPNSPGYRMVTIIFQAYCVTNFVLSHQYFPADVNSKTSSSPNKPLSAQPSTKFPSVKAVSPSSRLPYNQHCRGIPNRYRLPVGTANGPIFIVLKCEWAFRRGQLDRTRQPSSCSILRREERWLLMMMMIMMMNDDEWMMDDDDDGCNGYYFIHWKIY